MLLQRVINETLAKPGHGLTRRDGTISDRRTAPIEHIFLKGVDPFFAGAEHTPKRTGFHPTLDVGVERDILLVYPIDK